MWSAWRVDNWRKKYIECSNLSGWQKLPDLRGRLLPRKLLSSKVRSEGDTFLLSDMTPSLPSSCLDDCQAENRLDKTGSVMMGNMPSGQF